MSSKIKSASVVESLDIIDDEENCFFEGDVDFGKALVSFNFGAANSDNKTSLKENTIKASNTCEAKTNIFSFSPRGLTPRCWWRDIFNKTRLSIQAFDNKKT